MLVGGMFVLMRTFPASEVPDFETAGAAHERDLAFQIELFAKVIGQKEAALFVGGAVLRAGVELALENAHVAGRQPRGIRGGSAQATEFVRRHNEQALQILLGHEKKLLDFTIAPPARWNGHTMFLVDLMPKLSGEESLR